MEIYKLRYNLYNYIFDNDINYNLLIVSKNISKYFLIAIFIIFIIIMIGDTSKISYIIFFFILFGIILIYLTFLIDTSINNIKTNKKLIDYAVYFRLFNIIFIESYNTNSIPLSIKNNDYRKIDSYSLLNIINDKIPSIPNKNTFYNTSPIDISTLTTPDEKFNNYDTIKKNSIFSLPQFNGKKSLNYNINKEFNNDNFHYYKNNRDNKDLSYLEYLKFKSGTSHIYIDNDINIDILLVGGGGGGSARVDGFEAGGGGGGGQVRYLTSYLLSQGFYRITVGEGGAIGSAGNITKIEKKGDSDDFIELVLAGGGGGGITSIGAAIESGSGGGGGGNSYKIDTPTFGGTAKIIASIPKSSDGEGYQKTESIVGGGSGGGGIHSLTPTYNGININITGVSIGYGGGGRGGNDLKTQLIGTHGGGNGGGYISERVGQISESLIPTSGIVNTGGGGGGYVKKVAGQTSAIGGSGVVIMKILNQFTSKLSVYIPKENTENSIGNSIIICNNNENLDDINIVNNTNTNNDKYIYFEYLDKKEDTSDISKIYNDIYEYLEQYVNIHKDVIELIKVDYETKNNFKFLYSINVNKLDEKYKKSNILNNLHNLLKKYFITKITTITSFSLITGTDKFESILNNDNDNNYIRTFYNTLLEINNNIKYNDNIGENDIYMYSDELNKSNSILKYINVNNDNKYKVLKKWIFIKIDTSNEFHNEIKDDYNNNKESYIDSLETTTSDSKKINEVIIDISGIYNTGSTLEYFLIDIESINKILKVKNEENNEYKSTYNIYILNIYKKLLDNYNYKIGLNTTIENFDILFNVNKDIDKDMDILISDFIFYFNLIIIIVIIIMTIILHIFYIELFRFI